MAVEVNTMSIWITMTITLKYWVHVIFSDSSTDFQGVIFGTLYTFSALVPFTKDILQSSDPGGFINVL